MEDCVALGGSEVEALGDDAVLADTADDLQGSPQIFDGEGRSDRIGAHDLEATDAGVRQVERAVGGHQLAGTVEVRNAGASRVFVLKGQTRSGHQSNIGERVRGEIVIPGAGSARVKTKVIY